MLRPFLAFFGPEEQFCVFLLLFKAEVGQARRTIGFIGVKGHAEPSTCNNYKTKVPEGFGLVLNRKVVQKEKNMMQTTRFPIFRGSFHLPNMR